MLIRSATLADIPSVQAMVAKTCALHEVWDPVRYSFPPHPEQRYERWLGKRVADERSVFLVAENEVSEPGQPVALVAFLVAAIEREIPIYRLQEFGLIHELWVEPEYRNQGIGRELLLLAIKRLGQMGIKQIRLDVSVVNEPARRLYESCGFRPSTIEMLFEADSADSNESSEP
ncbi:GNAT family N-acetyltransferase [Leptolyngbya sp. FACHB-261]|uniref:GNAT family N-acetyltransferase n=1 Tax=Leptolyngbya sp. FACHB-261 TaxID=2692806 RepID=UPI001681F4A1|nr:GNAT family N-acetyltransferase [Leptolyngbya sp. FACHB-261]MBD2100036.1 GNAT family N-acetyltransferase [Leptolyngbya sp. FACHB-261]